MLPSRLIHVDSQKAEGSAGALHLERTRTATFASPDVGISAVPQAATTVVQLLPGRTTIAVAFWLIGKTLRTEENFCDCSAVSQLPSLTPIFLTPFTRRMPAATSGLRSPQSAASYAKRRTAPKRRLIVPGARWRDSR